VQRQSSRPPPGAGAYALSVNKADSDPPPADHVPVNAFQRSKSPPPVAQPVLPVGPVHPVMAPPAPAPDMGFGQIPWMEQAPAGQAAPAPAPPPAALAAHAANHGNGAAPVEQPARRRPPMKRTTTLIHGSMIQPDGLPPPEQAQAAPVTQVIDAEGRVLHPYESPHEPLPAAPTADRGRAGLAPAPAPERGPSAPAVTVVPAGDYWTAGVARSMAGWVIGLRNELTQVAMERSMGRCFVVLISCSQGTQKTKSLAVAQLALALAEAGHPRILLMEGDFDRPAVHQTMGVEMPRSAGFSQQMHNRIHGHVAGGWAVVGCLPTLHVMAEGRVRSPGLLHSFQFETAVNDLRRHYEMIIIDGPPLSVSTDMRALESVVDGIIVVQKPGGREPTAIERALFGPKLLKIVLADQLGAGNARS
jgi:Mrp family chromosome partitioning ATPase